MNLGCAWTLKSVVVTPRLNRLQKFNLAVGELTSTTLPASAIPSKVRFMLYTQKLTAQVLIQFRERLIVKRTRKLFWIVARHPVHRSSAVREWLAVHSDQIEMIYLPSHSPQLNPVAYLNCDVKQGVHSKPPTRDLAQLKRRVKSHLHKLQKLVD